MMLPVMFFAGCTRENVETQREPLPSDYKQVVDTIKVVERREGLPSFSLEAKTVIEFNDYIEFNDLDEVVTYSDGNPELKLTSNTAAWYQRQNRLEAIGDVNLFGLEEEFILQAPKVVYQTLDETFKTIGRATIITSSYRVSADKLDGSVKEKLLIARGNLILINEDGMEVEGSSLEFNWETNDYKVKGPITAEIKPID